MDTPGAAEQGQRPLLYGAGNDSINPSLISRRRVVALAALACPASAIAAPPQIDLLARAARMMGGATLLDRVRTIGWLGAAEIVTPERTLRLGIQTRVEPFVRASSTSWIIAEGVAKARTVVIEPGGGYVDRNGTRTALPDSEERHEREQYGLYGYMLLRAPTVAAGSKLLAARQGLPPIRFETDTTGRLTAADYIVHAPDGGEVIQQRLTFDGMVRNNGISWPRRISIAQDGVPFFTLAIDRLTVDLA